MLDKRIDLLEILKSQSQLMKIKVWMGHEVENDPTEHTKTITYLQSNYIDVYLQQISFESLKYKYFGQIPQDSLQIICDVKYEKMLKSAKKIEIDGKIYKVYFDDSNGFRMMKKSNYLITILERKAQEE
jgi:hypothetical protein